MKALFVHDHPFYIEDKEVYSGGSFPTSLWENYTTYFDSVNVFARISKNPSTKVVKSSVNDGKVIFDLTENYSSIPKLVFNLNTIKKELHEKINNSNITIVRLPSILGFIAGYICVRNRKPFIVEQVGSSRENYITNGSLKGKLISSFAERLNRYIVRKAQYVYYVTKTKLQNDYPTKGLTTSISNVILRELINKNDLDNSRFQNDTLKIGLIGGFDVSYKGQDILLKAVSSLDHNIKRNIELYFVGIGDYSWLVKLAKTLGLIENIKFIGPKESGKDIFNFLSNLSLYIQPSFTEGMPRGMLEAMSMGCPVLGSTAGGIADIVEDDFLHKPGDFIRISEQIENLYTDRDLLVSEAKRSIVIVEPYLKINLDTKRKEFYTKIIQDLKKDLY
ncbi:glycosyltransferase [Salegentibacter mishustinae]|uniref:glycosyltransferase n=1 Tax=Salegentibacter mishustinae TaxID=270918 RepID=UPI0024922CCE|nr:glycosyltransferase [Salegentibacter mishustinae]